MNDLIEKANTLMEALPYIQKFSGKTIVIKYGGHAMVDETLKKSLMLDLILMKYVGINPVVVHGGGPRINAMLERLDIKSQFINGLRVTDQETMDVVEMILMGKINKEIVSMINQHGGKAVGLSGKDGKMLMAQQRDPQLGFVGDIKEINPDIIHQLANEGYIPVISPIGAGSNGESFNINADSVAGELAAALKASKLIMLTDVKGIMADSKDEKSLISILEINQAESLIRDGSINKGMIPKVEACINALHHGVKRTHILDGRIPHAILLEIFTNKGIGTMVMP